MPDTGFNTGKDKPLINKYGLAQEGGIICPANRDEHGPAKQKIHCLVWKDWDDWLDNSEASGWPVFCEKVCHFGKMTAEQRSRSMRAHRAWLNLKKAMKRRTKWVESLRIKDRLGRTI